TRRRAPVPSRHAARRSGRRTLTPSLERAVVEDEAAGDRQRHDRLHDGRRGPVVHEQDRRVEDEERDPRPDEDAVSGDQLHGDGGQAPSTTLMASRVTLTSRSISAAVTTSGGAK